MLPSTSPVTRREALAGGAIASITGFAGCLDTVRDRLDPRTYHSDAVLGAPAEPWSTLGHDARHTGARESGTALPEEPTVERVGDGGGAFYEEPPAIDEEAVYTALHDNGPDEYRRAFVATEHDGTERWRVSWEESKAPAPPTVHGETAFLSRAGETVAVDRRTGERRWSYAAGIAPAAPVVVDETVYVVRKRLLALDAVTGELRWEADGVSEYMETVAATPETVYAESDGALYAVDPADGSVRWETPLDQGTYTTPVVGDESVFVAGSDGLLQAVGKDGTERWSQMVPGNQAAPALADGTVYVVADEGDYLDALDADTGERRFRTGLGPTVDHRPAVGGDAVYLLGYDDGAALFVVDAASGELRRTVPLGGPNTPPVDTNAGVSLADDAVYLTGEQGDGSGVFRVS